MKPLIYLLVIFIVLLPSCEGGRSPIHLPDNFPDTTTPQVYDPYQPDSICLFSREKTGSVIGEWMEIGVVAGGIISEPDCVTLDTTGFATRRDKRWVFKNDSIVETYSEDRPIKIESADITIGGGHGQKWKYEMRGVNDTIIMSEESHNWCDTLRITRMSEDTLILASVRYLFAFRPPERKSVIYVRRK